MYFFKSRFGFLKKTPYICVAKQKLTYRRLTK